MSNNKTMPRTGPYPSTLHPSRSEPTMPDRSIAPPRFTDTREVLEYGIKLGLGKATQEQALRQLKQRFPEHAEMFDNPMFLSGLKLALPLVGIQLAQQLSNEKLSARILDASQSMLLVNTIDTTADVTNILAQQAAEMGRFLLEMYGISGEEAQEGARQLAEDFGVPFPAKAATAEAAPKKDTPA